MWKNNIKVLIFDMDGPLYQEDSFLERYLTYMLEDRYSAEEIEQVINEVYDILNGKHSVSLGHYYNFGTNSIFTHSDLVPNGAFDWNGQKLNHHFSRESQLFYIGDPWCIAYLFGEKLGINKETNAYLIAE